MAAELGLLGEEVAKAAEEEDDVVERFVSSKRQESIRDTRVTSFCRRRRERKEPYSEGGSALIKAMQARSLSKASKSNFSGLVSFMALWAEEMRMQSAGRDSSSCFWIPKRFSMAMKRVVGFFWLQ